MQWWQVILVLAVVGLIVMGSVQLGANIADRARMRAVLDDRAKWEAPPND